MNFLEATYDSGKVILSNGEKLSLTKNLKKEHDSFYKKKIQDYEKEIESLNKNKTQAVNEETINAFDEVIKKFEENKATAELYLKGEPHPVKFGARPEDINVLEKNGIELEVGICELLGDEYYLHSKLGEDNLIIKTSSRKEIKSHTKINVAFEEERCHIFDIDSTERIY
jgi:ABC-type sugar transport system ATPase subunit